MKTDISENAREVLWKTYGFWKRMSYEDTGERLPTNYDFKAFPLKKTKMITVSCGKSEKSAIERFPQAFLSF